MSDAPGLDAFELWARTDPRRLLDFLCDRTVSPVYLGLAAEVAGSLGTTEARDLVVALLEHHSPFVREGAIYGLEPWSRDTGVRQQLKSLTQTDPSPAVRAAAADVLE